MTFAVAVADLRNTWILTFLKDFAKCKILLGLKIIRPLSKCNITTFLLSIPQKKIEFFYLMKDNQTKQIKCTKQNF